eukprot:3336579-Rhodomonas_salina.2
MAAFSQFLPREILLITPSSARERVVEQSSVSSKGDIAASEMELIRLIIVGRLESIMANDGTVDWGKQEDREMCLRAKMLASYFITF